jgi:hypothetical protein
MSTGVGQQARSARLAKGLATLAMLKTNLDTGQDHIDMLVPFVLDCAAAYPQDDFTSEDIRSVLASRHDLNVPAPCVRMVLNRATHKGAIRREGGRYFRTSVLAQGFGDIPLRRKVIEEEQLLLARALREFAGSEIPTIASDEGALALLLEFINHFHVDLLLPVNDSDEPPFMAEAATRTLEPRELHAVSRFILDKCLSDQELANALQRALQGFVLQNVLFLRDLANAGRRFSDLKVFLDTGFLLEALGMCGRVGYLAAKETIDVLRGSGAVLAVFDKTVNEIRRILLVYEQLLGTPSGIRSLLPTPVTRYVLAERWRPSDASEFSSLLENKLSHLGIRVTNVPPHVKEYTLDEKDLVVS